MEPKKPKLPLPTDVIKAMYEERLKVQEDKEKQLASMFPPGKKAPYMKSLFDLIGLN
ncbi:Uncharacterised protein [uncultured archaeon]|nr:Uncharacterised protein [uncultured archaeon]